MKFGIVIFPTQDIQNRANNLRKRYDTDYALIPPHITIKRTFEAVESDLTEMVAYLKKTAANVQPFGIKVTKISTFYPVSNTLYLKIEPSEQLVALHETMYRDYFTQTPGYSFIPRITVAQNLSDQEHADVFGRLKMKQFQYEQNVNQFHLISQQKDDSWKIVETFQLGKK